MFAHGACGELALDREKTLQAAQKYVDRRKYDRALEEYQKVVQQNPQDTRTLLKIGDVESRSGDFGSAIRTYDSVAEFYTRQGFSLKAIAVYKQIRELIQSQVPDSAPKYAHVVERLCSLYVDLGLTNDALSVLDEEATRLRGNDQEDAAVTIYRRMADVGKTVPISHLRLAEGLCRVGEVEEAMTSFWSAAELLIQGGRKPDALRVIERMLHFKPQPRCAKLAARLYLEHEAQPEAMQALSRLQLCFQADPKDIETLQLLARAFNVLEQQDKALEVQKEVARQAHQQGQPSLFMKVMAELTESAPDDEQVIALTRMPLPSISEKPGDPPSIEISQDPVPVAAPRPPPRRRDASTSSKLVNPPPRRHTAIPPPRTAADSGEVLELEPELLEDAPASDMAPEKVAPARSAASAKEVRDITNRALVEAQTARDLRQYDRAINAIQDALEYDPRSIELREMLRDLCAESGDRDGAIDEMLTMVAIYVEFERPDHARSVLLNILEAEPDHAVARQTLSQLEAQLDAYTTADAPRYSLHPSYARQSSQPEPTQSRPSDEAPSHLVASRSPSSKPLPRFEIEGESDNVDAAPTADELDQSNAQPSSPTKSTPSSQRVTSAPSAGSPVATGKTESDRPASTSLFPGKRGVEEALEEADFYSSRAMFEDARLIISDQLKENPNHPLLLENLEEIDDAIRRQAGTPDQEEEDFDLGASLNELEQVVRESQSPPEPGETEQEVDVDAVFAKFKQGVRDQISDSDSATHYDLGVAYREMNLVEDAISELELAARDPGRECTCHAMIGMLYLEQKTWPDAKKSFERALAAPQRTTEQETSIHYDLGHIAERQDKPAAALKHFTEVVKRNDSFRDVKERLEQLRQQNIGDGDDKELDRAFLELIGE